MSRIGETRRWVLCRLLHSSSAQRQNRVTSPSVAAGSATGICNQNRGQDVPSALNTTPIPPPPMYRRRGGFAYSHSTCSSRLGCSMPMDSQGNSPFATIISPKASKQITDFAVSELIADKLPFTPSRLKSGPFAARILSCAGLRGGNL